VRTLLALALLAISSPGQEIFDLLLKNGHVIDPANKRNERLDIAISNGLIAKVAKAIPAAHSRRTVDLSDYVVTPGLIDLNARFGGPNGVDADHNCLRSGVTTAIGSPAKGTRTRLLPLTSVRLSASPDGLKAGDILTGIYSPSAPALASARERGLLLDSGPLWFRIAAPAIGKGLLPDTISTGLDRQSALLPRATMTNTMSKFLALGVTLEQIVERTTAAPAKAIRHPELGRIWEGGAADLAVLEIRSGQFGFLDFGHARLSATKELRCVLTVLGGAVVWDPLGLSLTHWRDAGPYSNFK
jgi:predicted amidohydrolase